MIRVNLEPKKFATVGATSFSSNTPAEIKSAHREGRIVGVHVVADQNVTCRLWICKKVVDISADTIDESNILAWITMASNVVGPDSLYHMGGDIQVDFDYGKYLQGNIPVILQNLGGVQANFKVYLTIKII